jgi:hypothetical protein
MWRALEGHDFMWDLRSLCLSERQYWQDGIVCDPLYIGGVGREVRLILIVFQTIALPIG